MARLLCLLLAVASAELVTPIEKATRKRFNSRCYFFPFPRVPCQSLSTSGYVSGDYIFPCAVRLTHDSRDSAVESRGTLSLPRNRRNEWKPISSGFGHSSIWHDPSEKGKREVTRLLEDMKATLETEQKEDDELYDQLSCWSPHATD